MKGSRERILLVDDDPRNVRLLEGIFRADGYEVSKAHGGEEALELVESESPDLILLDVMMPGMSGHEVCARLKSNAETKFIPVILVTALNSVDDKVQGLDTGADDFVSKPINRLELTAKARSMLRVKALHDEVLLARDELVRKNEDLLHLEELKDSLVQMIVHDLKNPLTALMGNMELAMSRIDTQPGKARERVFRAQESGRGMMRMILNLLDIARMEEDRLQLRWETFDVGDTMDSCATEVDGLLRSAGLKLKRMFPETPVNAWGDREIVSRIVANLLSNAIKHTQAGGRITLGAEPGEDEVVLWVRDTGEGIPEEVRPLLFQKFGQLTLKRSGRSTDRGLGLAFCKLASEAHGGRIWMDSRPGQGSVFRVALPARAPREAGDAGDASGADQSGGAISEVNRPAAEPSIR